MQKRDYFYKTINFVLYGLLTVAFVALFVYVEQTWGNIPEEIQYVWGLEEATNALANKWGLFILIGLMVLHIKKINKKQRKLEKKQKIVNATVRWKRFYTALKTVLVGFAWSMVLIYIIQNSLGKEIQNGLHYILIVILTKLLIDFLDKIIVSMFNRKIKKKEVSYVKSNRKNFKKIRGK